MRSISRALVALASSVAIGCGGAAATESTTPIEEEPVAQEAVGLRPGGTVSNFGEATLSTGFLPDPHTVPVVSGASTESFVDVSGLGLAPSNSGTCTGFATAQPDFILRLETPGAALRFFVNAPADTTLVINDGAGNWWCSDDDGGNLNPLIDIASPPAGQYDIWVGSYQAGANIQGVLSVTELQSVHP